MGCGCPRIRGRPTSSRVVRRREARGIRGSDRRRSLLAMVPRRVPRRAAGPGRQQRSVREGPAHPCSPPARPGIHGARPGRHQGRRRCRAPPGSTPRKPADENLAASATTCSGWPPGHAATSRRSGAPQAGLDHARRSEQPWTLALVTALAGRSAHGAGENDAGSALLRDAETLAETIGEPMVLGSTLDYRAQAEARGGPPRRAAALATRSLAAYRSIGYQEGLASAGTLAATLAVLDGDHERADACSTRPSTSPGDCATSAARHPLSRRWPCSTTTEATSRAAAFLGEACALRRRTSTAHGRPARSRRAESPTRWASVPRTRDRERAAASTPWASTESPGRAGLVGRPSVRVMGIGRDLRDAVARGEVTVLIRRWKACESRLVAAIHRRRSHQVDFLEFCPSSAVTDDDVRPRLEQIGSHCVTEPLTRADRRPLLGLSGRVPWV